MTLSCITTWLPRVLPADALIMYYLMQNNIIAINNLNLHFSQTFEIL